MEGQPWEVDRLALLLPLLRPWEPEAVQLLPPLRPWGPELHALVLTPWVLGPPLDLVEAVYLLVQTVTAVDASGPVFVPRALQASPAHS